VGMEYVKDLCSIVIPIWNKAEETRGFCEKAIESIVEHVKYPYELILVDNASAFPLTGEFLYKIFFVTGKETILYCLPENVGFGPAVNYGATKARGEYLCQMNSDCELVEDSVSILIEVMNKHDLAVGMPENYGACKHYGLSKAPVLMGKDWRFGAFWVMRRSVWDEIGGFDEGYISGYFEDSDAWKKIEALGYKIAGWRGTWVYHIGNASSHPDRDKYFQMNRERYEKRWSVKYP